MEREIVLDTETTGLSPTEGHRVIEIGCVELFNRIPTGNNYHVYLNPQREVPEAAVNVHGLTYEFLQDKPLFKDVADEFLQFLGESRLIIHNADFDVKFLNAELFNAKKKEIEQDKVFCTLKFARSKFPGAGNSLDALCRRFNIDNAHRTLHGALLDSEILAEVYLELMGGKQVSIDLNSDKKTDKDKVISKNNLNNIVRRKFEKRDFSPSEDELKSHNDLVQKIDGSLWKKFSE